MANLTGSTTAVFFVRLSAAVDGIVDVDWSTRDGTAIAGKDYEAASGTVSFLPGETEKAIDVIVYGQDDVSADGKKFYIELKPPANAVLSDALAECVITVADEDGVLITSLVIAQGKRGLKGNPGLSAYEQAVLMGYVGTVEQWMAEIGDASQAAVRAESFASQAAESAVVAGQKADEATEAVGSTKQYVDSALSSFAMGADNWFPTLAAANAAIATIGVGKSVWVGDEINGGLWYKATAEATTLTKSPFDPVEIAKADATTKANAAEANAKQYVDANTLQQNFGQEVFNNQYAYNSSGEYAEGAGFRDWRHTDYIPVKAGDTARIVTRVAAVGFPYLLVYDQNKVRLQFFTVTSAQASELTTFTHTFAQDGFFISQHTAAATGCSIVINEGEQRFVRDRELPSKLNVAKTEAIAAAATDATTKANAAKTEAISAADANAKTYADNRAKLARPIVASNKVSRTIQNMENAQATLGTQIVPTIGPKVGSFVYLIAVKPNTTYSLVSTVTASPTVREFAAEPISEVSRLEALIGQTITMATYQNVPVLRRRGTFTTSENTNYITLDPRTYSNYDFVVVEGEYAEDIEASLIATTDQANKQARFDHLYAKNLQSDKFGKSKNLFKGYTFGSYLSTTRTVSSDYVSGLWLPGYAPTQAGYWDGVACIVPVKPNTTYTISKEESNRFAVLLCKDLTNSKLVLRDSSLRSYTVTTGAEDNFIAIVLSDIGEQPLVQIEEGANVTVYEAVGDKFAKSALPIGKKLTDIIKQTDNAYISLGMQSDEFRYYPTVPTQWTTDTVLNKYYEPLRAEFPANISRNILGKDASGLYDVYEYIFKPDNYEQTIFITAGMHTTEMVTPFALGILLNEIYRNPSKHEGLAYLRNKVKIVVIPVVNVWGANQNPKVVPTHYVNSNAVNPSRNFPERWEQIVEDGPYNKKGSAPASEAETQHILTVMHREKDELAFYLDLHTGQGWTQDTLLYWLEEDNFLRPVLQNIVSMRNDIVRKTLGREPINETHETQRATGTFYPWRVLGVPAGTIEYGTGSTSNLDNTQTTYYVDLVFNSIHYALKANLKAKRKQAELNEHNKQFISLYNTLSAYNNVVNQVWNYAQLQTNLYDKLGLTKSVIGAVSGTYNLVKYVHEPVGYKNTVVLSAGLRGKDTRKSVIELGFFAHKLMTDLNPHIVALRNSTRFIFIPCLNPHGYDNNIVNNANAVQPYLNFATSTQPESVVLRSLIDSETIDLFVDIDSLLNANKPSGYANLQVIYNAKADIEYSSVFSVLNAKYAVSNPASAANYSTALVKSQIADYINGKGIAYTYSFFAQNVLPLRTTVEGKYTDLGYEANELAYCSEVLLNSIKEICQRRTLSKYLAN